MENKEKNCQDGAKLKKFLQHIYGVDKNGGIVSIANGTKYPSLYENVSNYIENMYVNLDHDAINALLTEKIRSEFNKPECSIYVLTSSELKSLSGIIYDKLSDDIMYAEYPIGIKLLNISSDEFESRVLLGNKIEDISISNCDVLLYFTDNLCEDPKLENLAEVVQNKSPETILFIQSLRGDSKYAEELYNRYENLIIYSFFSNKNLGSILNDVNSDDILSKDYLKKIDRNSNQHHLFPVLKFRTSEFEYDISNNKLNPNFIDTYEIYDLSSKIYNRILTKRDYVCIGYEPEDVISGYLARYIYDKESPIDICLQQIDYDTIENIKPMEIMVYLTHMKDLTLIAKLKEKLANTNYKELIILHIKE